MGIPQVRDRLYELAEELDNEELRELADQMWRRPAIKRAPNRSPKLTPEMAEEIREYAAAHPTAHNQDIAEHFGVNIGRVSESLNYEV